MLSQFVYPLDLGGFLERISLAHSIAPILDPTLYNKGMRQLGEIENLARALVPFKQEIMRQIDRNTGK